MHLMLLFKLFLFNITFCSMPNNFMALLLFSSLILIYTSCYLYNLLTCHSNVDNIAIGRSFYTYYYNNSLLVLFNN